MTNQIGDVISITDAQGNEIVQTLGVSVISLSQ